MLHESLSESGRTMWARVKGRTDPLLKRIAPRYVTTAENIGRAMIVVAADGYSEHILESTDINLVAAAA